MAEIPDTPTFPEHTEWVEAHVREFFPDAEILLFHELFGFSRGPMVVFWVKGESYDLLITCGMSSRAMSVEASVENAGERRFAELMLLIPKGLEFLGKGGRPNENEWLVSALQYVARFPHQYETWLGVGHTIQANAEGGTFQADSAYSAGIILPSVTLPKGFTELRREGRLINIFSLFFLYPNELEFKLKNGYSRFVDLLMEQNVREVFEFKRKNLLPKKGFWSGIFG